MRTSVLLTLVLVAMVHAGLNPPAGKKLPRKIVFKARSSACNNHITSASAAKAVCAQYGAKLATKSQLNKFVTKFGMTECGLGRCGFACNRVFEVFCEEQKKVARCPDDPKERGLDGYDVYCFGVAPSQNQLEDKPCVTEVTEDPCDGKGPQELAGQPVECRNGNILIQHNAPCSSATRVSFDKDWQHYRNGFGNPAQGYWAGLETMHRLTTSADYRLIIELTTRSGDTYWAYYDNFVIGAEGTGFKLTVGRYHVPEGLNAAGDAFNQPQAEGGKENGSKFSTSDRDNDDYTDSKLYRGNCAILYGAGWWFSHCHRGLMNAPCTGDRSWGPEVTGAPEWEGLGWLPDNKTRLDSTYMMIQKM